jgi:hypothetical protein
MESEETGEENRGTSKEYGPRRRSSGKQQTRYCSALLEENNYFTLLVFALTLVYVCTTILYVALLDYYSRLTAVIQRYGNEF